MKVEFSFLAMGSTFRIRIDSTNPIPTNSSLVNEFQHQLVGEVEHLEQTLSRFRDDSELTLLNRQVGSPVQISECLRDVLQLAETMIQNTDGLFQPSVLSHLERIGYHGASLHRANRLDDEGANVVGMSSGGEVSIVDDTSSGGEARFGDPVTMDVPWVWIDSDVVQLHAPIDLGGIGKGYAADTLTDVIERESVSMGLVGAMIDAGGDLVVLGHQEDGSPWNIGIENPLDTERMAAVVSPGAPGARFAVCTSSVMRNAWEHSGQRVHHLIHPRTGTPAETHLASVTALGERAATTEVLSKMVLLEGTSPWSNWLGSPIQIIAVSKQGKTSVSKSAIPFVIWTAEPL